MLTASCHCGAVRVTVPAKPRTVTDCNCSICRRYGTLWAYYQPSTVRVEAAPGATHAYSWGARTLRFVSCATCGCIMCWEPVPPDSRNKMGVNARNFEPEVLGQVEVRAFDGASM